MLVPPEDSPVPVVDTTLLHTAAAVNAAFADREIVTTRVFDAPREFMFKAWTDPDQLAHWWGPMGFTNTFQELDMRPVGIWRFTAALDITTLAG